MTSRNRPSRSRRPLTLAAIRRSASARVGTAVGRVRRLLPRSFVRDDHRCDERLPGMTGSAHLGDGGPPTVRVGRVRGDSPSVLPGRTRRRRRGGVRATLGPGAAVSARSLDRGQHEIGDRLEIRASAHPAQDADGQPGAGGARHPRSAGASPTTAVREGGIPRTAHRWTTMSGAGLTAIPSSAQTTASISSSTPSAASVSSVGRGHRWSRPRPAGRCRGAGRRGRGDRSADGQAPPGSGACQAASSARSASASPSPEPTRTSRVRSRRRAIGVAASPPPGRIVPVATSNPSIA